MGQLELQFRAVFASLPAAYFSYIFYLLGKYQGAKFHTWTFRSRKQMALGAKSPVPEQLTSVIC